MAIRIASGSKRSASFDKVIVSLDFDGGVKLYRNAELGMDIPMCIAPSGISAQRRTALIRKLNGEFSTAGVRFASGSSAAGGGGGCMSVNLYRSMI